MKAGRFIPCALLSSVATFLLLAALFPGSAPAATSAFCGRPCPKDPACAARRGGCLLRKGKPKLATAALKGAAKLHPQSRPLHLLLALSYLARKNLFWAMRILNGYLSRKPADCEARSWMAWLQIRQGAFDAARDVLKKGGCPARAPMKTRWAILGAAAHSFAGKMGRARASLERARAGRTMFVEDGELLSLIERKADPARIRPFSLRVTADLGWASNGLMASPIDPATTGKPSASALGGVNLWGRFVAPLSGALRPTVEAGTRTHLLAAEGMRDLSYLDLSMRAGLLIGRRLPRLLVAYGGQGVLMFGGDKYGEGPRWFAEAHRAEVEVEVTSWLVAIAGAGKRLFREAGRTRTEADLSLGLHFRPAAKWLLLLVISSRYHSARAPAYDLLGMTGLVSIRRSLGGRFAFKNNAMLGYDSYPDSLGAFETGKTRQDLLFKNVMSASVRFGSSVRLALEYEFSNRHSSAAAYAFKDHRLRLRLVWYLGWDPWRPKVVRPMGHVTLAHGLGGSGGAGMDERIQDLLRQDESARRSSSCLR